VNKNPPSTGKIAAMIGFALSVAGLLLFLWVSFGGSLPLKPHGYRFEADFPQASLLVQEADVRMAGVNIGKVKSKELAPGGQTTRVTMEIDHHFAPIRADTRAILRQKSLLGETYVELTPGSPGSPDLKDGGRLPEGNVDDTVQLDQVFQVFDPRTRQAFRDWMRESGILSEGEFSRDLSDSIGNAAPFFEGGADLLRPLAHQDVALRRIVRDGGRVFHAISRENGQLRGVITNGDATFSALASRDEALAETFQILPTFLRETRATVRRLEGFARNTDPLVRDLREPADDLAPTLRDVEALSPDLERLFNDVSPLVTASRTGVPAATRLLRGAEPLFEATHPFLTQLNPILAYLSFSQAQIGQFFALGAGALGGAAEGGTGTGGYQGHGAGEHYLSQIAVIDSRSVQRQTTRPPYERANAYVAPNAYLRAIGFGVIESFDCAPAGGEKRNGSGLGNLASPPCFIAPPELFQHQKFARLRAGQVTFTPAPKGRAGTRPATP
jgi:phospholipid/cholesterol/gamma-HCH transport system substrate-binding protein